MGDLKNIITKQNNKKVINCPWTKICAQQPKKRRKENITTRESAVNIKGRLHLDRQPSLGRLIRLNINGLNDSQMVIKICFAEYGEKIC